MKTIVKLIIIDDHGVRHKIEREQAHGNGGPSRSDIAYTMGFVLNSAREFLVQDRASESARLFNSHLED